MVCSKVTLAFTEIHPTVVALDRQIERVNTELIELNSQVRELPTTQQELLGLIRDVEVTPTVPQVPEKMVSQNGDAESASDDPDESDYDEVEYIE